MEHTETLIVEQLKIGNEDAYQYIYDRHYALLCHVASGYVKDQFLAETIVGDTIFHLWEIRETLEISVSIRSYLVRAVRNRCINYLNSEWEKREIAFSSRFEGKSYEEISQELGISVNTVKYHIKNALASLQMNLSKYLITLLLFFFG